MSVHDMEDGRWKGVDLNRQTSRCGSVGEEDLRVDAEDLRVDASGRERHQSLDIEPQGRAMCREKSRLSMPVESMTRGREKLEFGET